MKLGFTPARMLNCDQELAAFDVAVITSTCQQEARVIHCITSFWLTECVMLSLLQKSHKPTQTVTLLLHTSDATHQTRLVNSIASIRNASCSLKADFVAGCVNGGVCELSLRRKLNLPSYTFVVRCHSCVWVLGSPRAKQPVFSRHVYEVAVV